QPITEHVMPPYAKLQGTPQTQKLASNHASTRSVDTLNSPLGTKSLDELDAAHCDSSSPAPPRNHGRPRSRTDRWRVTRDHDLAAGLPSGPVHDVRAYLSTGRSVDLVYEDRVAVARLPSGDPL